MEPLAEVVSIQVARKIHSNMFGQVVGGELVIKGFLLEIVNRYKCGQWLFTTGFDISIDTEQARLYFIPLGWSRLGRKRPRNYMGLIVQEAVQHPPGARRSFKRVGSTAMLSAYMAGLEEKLKSGQVEEILLV